MSKDGVISYCPSGRCETYFIGVEKSDVVAHIMDEHAEVVETEKNMLALAFDFNLSDRMIREVMAHEARRD